MSATLWTLDDGTTARVIESDGDRVALFVSRPAPPGSSIEARTDAIAGTYAVKVRSCRRQDEGYRIEGRFINLTRARREALIEALGAEQKES